MLVLSLGGSYFILEETLTLKTTCLFQEKDTTADMKSIISYSFIALLLANSAIPAYGWGLGAVIGGVVGAGAAFVAAPAILAGAGFTAAGIAAGSVASSMMAASAPVAVGSFVAVAQSAGAAGLALGTKAAIVGAGALAGAAMEGSSCKNDKRCNNN